MKENEMLEKLKVREWKEVNYIRVFPSYKKDVRKYEVDYASQKPFGVRDRKVQLPEIMNKTEKGSLEKEIVIVNAFDLPVIRRKNRT